METPMPPRFSTPDSIQLTFFLGGGLVLEILFFLSFFICVWGALLLFVFPNFKSYHVSALCQFAQFPLMFLMCLQCKLTFFRLTKTAGKPHVFLIVL